MRIHPGTKIYVWLFVIASVALAAFTGGLVIWAAQIDLAAKHREQYLVGAGIQARIEEVAATVVPEAGWDQAVEHLDNRFDVTWARAYITAYLEQNGGFETIYVLGAGDQPIYASRSGRLVDAGTYAAVKAAATPLVMQMRAAEARRGPILTAPPTPDGRAQLLSMPIQASNFDVINGKAYLVTASLVQPDFGTRLITRRHAPVILTMLPADGSFSAQLASRFKLDHLTTYVGQPGRTQDASRRGSAVLKLATSNSAAPLTFVWMPQTPGARLVRASLPFIALVLAVIIGAGVLVVSRSGRIAARLDASEADAKVNAERLRLALQSSKAGVFEVDFVRRSFWCSPEFVEVIGRALTFEEAAGKAWPVAHPDDEALIATFIRDRRKGSGPALLEFRVVLATGEARWIQSRSKVQRNTAGQLDKVFGIVLDIDERKRQELVLLEAQQAAQAATEAKSQFLANMSHEIRTPMNGVLGVLHLLGRESLSDGGRRLLGEAERSGHMLAELLNDMVDFSRIEAGRLELSSEPVDPADTLASVAEMLRPQAEAKGLILDVETPPTGDFVLGDQVRLRQVLFNLLGNAVKFTAKGRIWARLKVDDGTAGRRRLRFEVQDTGIGIRPAAQASLFERFHQGDGSTSREYGGSGLGLAISRSLVQMMGGEVGFVSAEGEGSTFWIELEAQEARHAPSRSESADAPLAGLKVLLVEDNATNRLVATTLLESLGAAVEVTVDGVDGLHAVQASPFDLVLMDIQMPRMDGVTAARRIRALQTSAGRTPIIALTANVLAHQQAQYREAGMDGVAAKPISAAALTAEIRRVLEQNGDIAAA